MFSNVIKARTAGGAAKANIVKRDVQTASEIAQTVAEQAHKEAQRICEAAREQARQISAEAQAKGYEEGLARWNQNLTESWRLRDKFLAENERALIELAIRVSEKIIGEELQASPDRITALARQALKSVKRAKNLVIKIHPEQGAVLREKLADLKALLGPGRELEIADSGDVPLNGCILETDVGTIDARLDTQLRLMKQVLLGDQS
jgi:flagellar assembly protein FliH